MKILYAGDSPAGGSANYLLGILRWMGADFLHLPPGKKLAPSLLKQRYDAFILSDYSVKSVSTSAQKMIANQVDHGAGLMMIGGWGSFSGPFGGWRGSQIEELLPVKCANRDDRMNFPSGAWIVTRKFHPALRPISFQDPPVICGLNQIQPKRKSDVVLAAKRIEDGREFPLLVVGTNSHRSAALATDLAPHWCGGMVDWGKKRLHLPVKGKIKIEVGNLYAQFAASLIRWLARR